MKDIVEKSNQLVKDIKKAILRVDDCENFKQLLEEGTVAIAGKGGTTYLSTILTDEVIAEIKLSVIKAIQDEEDRASGFLKKLTGEEEPEELKREEPEEEPKIEEPVAAAPEAQKKTELKKAVEDPKEETPKHGRPKASWFNVEDVKKLAAKGYSSIEIWRELYPNKDYSDICKRIRKSGIPVANRQHRNKPEAAVEKKPVAEIEPDYEEFDTYIPAEELPKPKRGSAS